jgi:hypothetical protein
MSLTGGFIVVGVFLALLAALLWLAARWGGAKAEKDFCEAGNDKAKQALEIDDRVKSLPDDDRAKWLRGN